MSKTLLPVEQVLTLVTETPKQLTTLTAGVAPARLQTPVDGEWSVNDVLAHLRACADVWGGCIAAILAEDKPTLRAINPRTWIRKTDYPEQKFQGSLRAFVVQRNELLARLRPLTPHDWSRSATVMGAGAPLERTVQFYAQWLGEHERPHIKQIKRMLDK